MFGNKLKKILSNSDVKEENKNENKSKNKKKIENLVFFIIIAIITVFAINMICDGGFFSGIEQKSTNKEIANIQSSNIIDNKENTQIKNSDLEENLKSILGKINNVGKLDVYINYSETSEVIAMYNETSKVSKTEESDDTGGVRKIEETDLQKDVVFQEESGEKIPVTQKVVEPKIEGAIITAQGAENSMVKTNIIQAVEAVTGLPTHKIQVFEMNQN